MANALSEPEAQQLEIIVARMWRRTHDPQGHERRQQTTLGCLIALALHGLRVEEITRLNTADLFARKARLRVRTLKGGTQRCIPIAPDLGQILCFLSHANATGPLLPTRTNTRHAPNATTQRISKWLHENIGPYTAHSLRHTAAVRCWHTTKDLRAVAHLLGHATLRETDKYLRIHLPPLAGLPDWPQIYNAPNLKIHQPSETTHHERTPPCPRKSIPTVK